MIRVTRLDGSQLYVNADLIEFVESTPDTVITLTTHHKMVVRDAAEAVIDAVIAYQRRVKGPAASLVLASTEA